MDINPIIVEFYLNFGLNAMNAQVFLGTMVQIDVIEWVFGMKFHFIQHGSYTKPGNSSENESISTQKTVLNTLSFPISGIICPGSKISSIGDLL